METRRTRQVGLARALSKLGFCSRSQANELIKAGRVRLNGQPRTNPETPVRLGLDRIEVDHLSVAAELKTYLMLNKPRGVVTTASDEKERATVYSLLSEDLPWVGPVGRLDQASEGLLLLTNDTEWAARISDPFSHVDKTYHVQVNVVADDGLLSKLMGGTAIDGQMLRAKEVRVLRPGDKNSWLEIVLDEGKNRQIRRMLESSGVGVLRLVRVAIGGVGLGQLAKGNWRALSGAEKEQLDLAVKTSRKESMASGRASRRRSGGFTS
jgi:23S rRNA pseudouridine2605 synthase